MEDSPTIMRIMSKRVKKYSKGGMIANDDTDEMADAMPAEFDDLANRDELEFSYTGENSGDELGNSQEEMDRRDTVARIMRQRKMKQSNPRPA